MLSVHVMHLLTPQNCVLNAERSPHIPVRYLLGYRDRQNARQIPVHNAHRDRAMSSVHIIHKINSSELRLNTDHSTSQFTALLSWYECSLVSNHWSVETNVIRPKICRITGVLKLMSYGPKSINVRLMNDSIIFLPYVN